MDKQVLDFLGRNRVSVLTTIINKNIPHSAALHYSHDLNSFNFYFSIDKTSRKCIDLISNDSVKASLVVGFSEERWITFQAEGIVRVVKDMDLKKIKEIHYQKHPNSQKFENNPNTIFISFQPDWWRYTDFNTDPLTIISSEGSLGQE